MTHIVIAEWTARPGEGDQVARVLAELIPGNRAEPKMLDFRAYRCTDDPDVFTLVETYTDASGYDDHRATAEFQSKVLGDIIPRLAERSVQAYTVLEPARGSPR